MFEYVMKSDAWRHMSSDAKVLYIEFRRIAMKDREDRNRINMSVRQAAELINVSKNRANAVLRELIEYGFVVVTKESSFNVKGRTSKATVYRITHIGDKGDRTNDFMAWALGPTTRDHDAQ